MNRQIKDQYKQGNLLIREMVNPTDGSEKFEAKLKAMMENIKDEGTKRSRRLNNSTANPNRKN